MAVRSQPYRLDWYGPVTSMEEMGTRLGELYVKSDEMFQTLFDDLNNLGNTSGTGGAALTGISDTNVTITLGGTPLQALLRAASITLGWTGILSTARGGTGFSGPYVTGDVLVANSTTTIAGLNDISTGNVLLSGGANTVPSYGKVGLATHVSGNLPVTNLNSGTNADSSHFWRGDGTWATVSTGTGTHTLTGTTNQVVLSAAGTLSLLGSNDITLSLPQDIATSSSVQFAKLGLGVAPTRFLDVQGATEQVRIAFDASNRASLIVGSAGQLSINLTGTNPSLALNPSGTGNVSITTGNSTGTLTTSGFAVIANNTTTGTVSYAASSTLTSGIGLDLRTSGTAALTGMTALNILNSGATSTNAQTTYGAQIANTRTNATSGTNVALELNASGATTGNKALIVDNGVLSITTGNILGGLTFASLALNENALTTGTGLYLASNSLTSGFGIDIQISGTVAANNQTALNIVTTGVNGTAGITSYAAKLSNTHSTNTSTNIALYLNASGGATANYAMVVASGFVGIGILVPALPLQVCDSNAAGVIGAFASTAGKGVTINPNVTAGIVDIYSDFLGGAEPALHIGNYSSRAGTGGITIDTSGNVGLGKKINIYNAVNTTGWGSPAIYATGRATGQTAANASVATYTVGAADGSFILSSNFNVTTSGTFSITVRVTYTDETNTARNLDLNFQNIGSTISNTITNAGGAVPYEGIPVHIRAKASTAITFTTVGVFTSVTYNVEGSIIQIA